MSSLDAQKAEALRVAWAAFPAAKEIRLCLSSTRELLAEVRGEHGIDVVHTEVYV
jgi:hypothetical protein